MAFALSIDDFVISNFVAGNVETFPLWIYGAVRVGIPPQVFVLGTVIFAAGRDDRLHSTWFCSAGRSDTGPRAAPTEGGIPVATKMDTERIAARAAEIAATGVQAPGRANAGSEKLHRRALDSMPNGVASNFQAGDPYPIYLERGKGSHVWDVDGTEYVDCHGGFGVNVVGHAHPKIVEAIAKAARAGRTSP